MRPVFLDNEPLHPALALIGALVAVTLYTLAVIFATHVVDFAMFDEQIKKVKPKITVQPANATTLLTCTPQGVREYLHACAKRGEKISARDFLR